MDPRGISSKKITAKSDIETAQTTTPQMGNPTDWDIRAHQNNWNWKSLGTEKPESDKIDYQIRFSEEDLGNLHRGADVSAPLLATIKIDRFNAEITFPPSSADSALPPRDSISMRCTANSLCWPIQVHALGNRTLNWEYKHPAYGDDNAWLVDPATGEWLGYTNDHIFGLYWMPDTAVEEELVVFGAAAMMMLVGAYGTTDMIVAMSGPEGKDGWKYQDLDGEEEDLEEEMAEEETDEKERRVKTAMVPAGKGAA